MLQLVYGVDGFACQDFRRGLIDQVVAALDGIVHMPLPVIFFLVAECGCHPSLRRSRVGTCRVYFCQHGNQEEDHWKWHMYDTVKGGDYLVDQPAAEILTREAIDAVYELEHRGLPFNRTADGRIDQRRFGGHTRNFGEGPVRRSCYAADRTGHMILQTMYQNAIKNQVRFFNEYLVLDLLLN